jgi:hypothetical protein
LIVVLNMSDEAGRVLLELVIVEAERLREVMPSLTAFERAEAQQRLRHVEVVRHRLEVGLWLPDPFTRRPAPEDGPETPDLFARRRKT